MTPDEAYNIALEVPPEIGTVAMVELGPERLASFMLAIEAATMGTCVCEACHIIRSITMPFIESQDHD